MATGVTNTGESTFIWRIENFTFCLERQYEVVSSPVFCVSIDGNESKWYLHVYPRLDSSTIAYNVYRHSSSKNGEAIGEIQYEVFLIDVDGVLSKSVQGKIGADGKSMLAVRQKILKEKNTLLPLDTLTIGCRMWKRKEELLKATKTFARTRIGVEERSFIWDIEKFSSILSSDIKTIVVESFSERQPSMNLKLFLRDTLFGGKRVQIEIHQPDGKSRNLTVCRVTLLDAMGEISESLMDEHWFDPQDKKVWSFPFFIPKSKLLANNSAYLPNDVLSLRFEWTVSVGIIYNKLEDADFGLLPCQPQNMFLNACRKSINPKAPCQTKSSTSNQKQEMPMGTDSSHSEVNEEKLTTHTLKLIPFCGIFRFFLFCVFTYQFCVVLPTTSLKNILPEFFFNGDYFVAAVVMAIYLSCASI